MTAALFLFTHFILTRPLCQNERAFYFKFILNLFFNFTIKKRPLEFILGIVNNVFNTEYIADARDGTGSVTDTALVWFGFGRTYSVSAKIRF